MSGDFERRSSFGNKSTKNENIDEPAGQFCPSNPDSPLRASGKTNKGQNILPENQKYVNPWGFEDITKASKQLCW